MLFQHGYDLKNKIVLLLGNGPSSWWVTAEKVRKIRELFDNTLVVMACNRTAAKVGADVACAVDRAMVREFLVTGGYHARALLIGLEVFRALVAEDRSLDELDGFVDGPHSEGGNVFFFRDELQGTGTGSATFQTIARMGADAIYLLGFDGAQDPRTRWAGSENYRKTPTHPGLLGEWNRQIVAAARAALVDGTVGAIGAAPTPGGELLHAIGAEKHTVPRQRRPIVQRFLLFMDRACERAACLPSA